MQGNARLIQALDWTRGAHHRRHADGRPRPPDERVARHRLPSGRAAARDLGGRWWLEDSSRLHRPPNPDAARQPPITRVDNLTGNYRAPSLLDRSGHPGRYLLRMQEEDLSQRTAEK